MYNNHSRPITVIHQIMPDNTKLMSTNIVVIFPHKYVKVLTIFTHVLALYHMGFFKDFCIFVRGVPFPLCTSQFITLCAHQEIDGTVYLKGRVLTDNHKDYFQSGKKFDVL